MQDIANRKIAEDEAVYRIFFLGQQDLPLALQEILAYVLSLCTSADCGGGYIWQREGFTLALSSDTSHLEGRTKPGDCVEDEWFIVWLLSQISRRWSNAVVSINDTDGEFLLIEAADVLPKWVTPTNAENRVWIKQGRLHLIPLQYKSAVPLSKQSAEEDDQEEGYLSEQDALHAIESGGDATLASTEIEASVFQRIAQFPGQVAKTHIHRTLAYLSPEIASVLRAKPQLVAPAVTTFYERDSVALKACQFMSRFPPSSATPSLSSVKMTRTLYAQLIGQKFYPPKPFEKAGWMKEEAQDSVEGRRREIGMKLMCGFEMLYQETKSSLTKVSVDRNHPQPQVDLSKDPAYSRFLENLRNLDYFQGEITGSKLHTELLTTAREQYLAARQTSSDKQQSFAQQVEETLAQASSPSAVTSLLTAASEGPEDSEDWLNIDPQGLEEILKERQAGNSADRDPNAQEQEEAERQAAKLTGLADKFESFLNAEGSMDGALLDDELSDDEEDSDTEMVKPTAAETKAAQDKLIPSLPTEEWGSHTQKKSVPIPADDPPPLVSELKLQPDHYDGASDDEDDEDMMNEDESALQIDEDGAQIVDGDEEVDMDQEMEDFLKFTREALGLTAEQYEDILKSRADRGAFVPTFKGKLPTKGMDMDEDIPAFPSSKAGKIDPTSTLPGKPETPTRNPKLNDFESLMDAMDAELAKTRSSSATSGASGKGQDTPMRPEEDEDAQLDAELFSLLKRDPTEEGDEGAQYGLIKNLLESFSSQNGSAGPVSNMFGVLDPKAELPYDAK